MERQLTLREKVALGIGAAGVVAGLGAWYLDAPKTLQEFQQNQREQQIQDLNDSRDNDQQRIDDETEDLKEAEDERKRIPEEHRPRLPLPGKW